MELIITVAMILIVSTFAMPTFLNYYRTAKVRAAAQTVSAIVNQGRQLAIKTNQSVAVCFTTPLMSFRVANCAGATIPVVGLTGNANTIRIPEGTTLTGGTATFASLGNATGATYTLTDIASGSQLNVVVAASGRTCLSSTTSCP